MPYIKQEDRIECEVEADTPGELNFLITQHCLDYLAFKGERYETLNAIIGVLECAKQEFYRRAVAPYENQKIIENGDVY